MYTSIESPQRTLARAFSPVPYAYTSHTSLNVDFVLRQNLQEGLDLSSKDNASHQLTLHRTLKKIVSKRVSHKLIQPQRFVDDDKARHARQNTWSETI